MIATKYAKLLFEQSRDRGTIEALTRSYTCLANDKIAMRFFAYPPDKSVAEAILRSVLSALKLEALIIDFLCIVVRHKRFKYIPQIIEEYERLLETMDGAKRVIVTSARQLTKEYMAQVQQMLKDKISGDLSIKYDVNPQIIGGMVIRTDEAIIDASIRGAIDKITKINC